MVDETLSETTPAKAAAPDQRDDGAVAMRTFLAATAHDFRSALNACFLWLDILELGLPLTEETAKAMKAFRRGLEKQSKLVGQLVDAGTISSGGVIEIQPEVTRLAEIVEAAIADRQPVAEERGVRLSCERPAPELSLSADPQRLRQALSAVLEHAISSTPSGGVVSMAVAQEAEAVEITVRDSGNGMSAEDLANVFVPFWSGKCMRQDALGVGLIVARHLIERHEGRLRAHSDGAGSGSAFSIRLPLAAGS